MSYIQAPYMHGHIERGVKDTPLVLRESGLPPRYLFENHPDVLEKYDALVALATSYRNQQQAAMQKRAAVEQAQRDYQARVAQALAKAEDPSGIKSKAEQYAAEALAHDKFASDARSAIRNEAGHKAGAAIKAVAPDLIPDADERLDAAAATVGALLDQLESAFTAWTTAWADRRWLSLATIAGGSAANYGHHTLAPEVREALKACREVLSRGDELRSDEANVRAWRAQESEADEKNRATLPAHLRG